MPPYWIEIRQMTSWSFEDGHKSHEIVYRADVWDTRTGKTVHTATADHLETARVAAADVVRGLLARDADKQPAGS